MNRRDKEKAASNSRQTWELLSRKFAISLWFSSQCGPTNCSTFQQSRFLFCEKTLDYITISFALLKYLVCPQIILLLLPRQKKRSSLQVDGVKGRKVKINFSKQTVCYARGLFWVQLQFIFKRSELLKSLCSVWSGCICLQFQFL